MVPLYIGPFTFPFVQYAYNDKLQALTVLLRSHLCLLVLLMLYVIINLTKILKCLLIVLHGNNDKKICFFDHIIAVHAGMTKQQSKYIEKLDKRRNRLIRSEITTGTISHDQRS